jgi:hypothetical protein
VNLIDTYIAKINLELMESNMEAGREGCMAMYPLNARLFI